MKKLLLAMLFAAVLVAAASPVGAQVSMTFLSYYGSQVDALNALINRALDSPPYTKGHSYTSTSGTIITLTFATAESKVGYYCWTYIMYPAGAGQTGTITVVKTLGGVTLESLTISPGATIADFVACDQIQLGKTVATDVVYYGGFYNR